MAKHKHKIKHKQPKHHNKSKKHLLHRISNHPIFTKPHREHKSFESLNVIDKYEVLVDNAKVNVSIEKTDKGMIYKLYYPKLDVGTSALLEGIRKELIAVTSLTVGEMIDEKSIVKVKKRFMIDAGKLFKDKIPSITKETEELLVGILMQEMLGLGKIEFLINDPNLEEIVIIGSKENVRAFHKKYGWLITDILIETEEIINNYANIIARRVGRQINILSPLLDAHIVTGDRANAVLAPISSKGNTITIRKFSRDPMTIIDLIKNKTVNMDVAVLLWLAIEYEMNVLISGGTASGKTVFLNSCMAFMPPNHRIISMEDTRELMLPEFLYWAPLVTRAPNPEGKGEVSMLDLLVNSLRMRPDRIILGEIRRQREAEVLFEAMHTGHSVYATLHADTGAQILKRLIEPPIEIPPSEVEDVHLVLVQYRDRRKNLRRTLEISEVVSGPSGPELNRLYLWRPRTDDFQAVKPPRRYMEHLNLHTGMTEKDILVDQAEKKKVLKWMLDNKLSQVEDVGKTMNIYYSDKDGLLKSIDKKMKADKVLI